MAHTLHIDVVSAAESIYSGEAEFVVLPGEAGELGIYPQHTPLITRIKPGSVRIKPAGGAAEEFPDADRRYLSSFRHSPASSAAVRATSRFIEPFMTIGRTALVRASLMSVAGVTDGATLP